MQAQEPLELQAAAGAERREQNRRMASLLVVASVFQVPMLLCIGVTTWSALSLALHGGGRLLLAFCVRQSVPGARWLAVGLVSAPIVPVVLRPRTEPGDALALGLTAAFAVLLAAVLFGRAGKLRASLSTTLATFVLLAGALFVPRSLALVPPDPEARALCAKQLAAIAQGKEWEASRDSVTVRGLVDELESAKSSSTTAGLLGKAMAEATFGCPPVSRDVSDWSATRPRPAATLAQVITPGARACYCQGLDMPLLAYMLSEQ